VLKGSAVLVVDKQDTCLTMSVQKFEKRQISEPPSSNAIRGPREGFNENVKSNIALIRQRLKSPDLVLEDQEIGKYSKTKVTLCYIKTIASNEVLERIKERLEKIDIDGIIDSSYIESYLEEHKKSIFKQVGSSERPDVVVAKILEGRIAILVSGSPVVLTVPFIIMENFQSPDDYYKKLQMHH
jgi:spore germination protein KA